MTDATDRALAAFSTFVRDWTPPAAREVVYAPRGPLDRVQNAIRGIADQTVIPGPGPCGWAVFSQHLVNRNSDGVDGWRYEIETAVFPTAVQVDNAYHSLLKRRPDELFIIGEVRQA